MDFTEWLHQELQDRGWSQSELARRGAISQSAISSVLTHRSRPGERLCIAIARAFNMPTNEVFRQAQIPIPQRETTKTALLMHYAEMLDTETLDLVLTLVRKLTRQ